MSRSGVLRWSSGHTLDVPQVPSSRLTRAVSGCPVREEGALHTIASDTSDELRESVARHTVRVVLRVTIRDTRGGAK